MVAVAVGSRKLKTGVVHRGGIHCNGSIGHTGLFRNRNSIQKVFAGILVPLGCKLQAVAEQGEVDTHIVGLLFLPCQVIVHESRNGRTGHYVTVEIVSHVVARHDSLIHILTDILVTEFTIAGTDFEEVHGIWIEREEALFVEAPAHRDGGEGAPTDVSGQAGTTIAAHGCREQVSVIVIVVDTTDVGQEGMLVFVAF